MAYAALFPQGDGATVALPIVPAWFSAVGSAPQKLGLRVCIPMRALQTVPGPAHIGLHWPRLQRRGDPQDHGEQVLLPPLSALMQLPCVAPPRAARPIVPGLETPREWEHPIKVIDAATGAVVEDVYAAEHAGVRVVYEDADEILPLFLDRWAWVDIESSLAYERAHAWQTGEMVVTAGDKAIVEVIPLDKWEDECRFWSSIHTAERVAFRLALDSQPAAQKEAATRRGLPDGRGRLQRLKEDRPGSPFFGALALLLSVVSAIVFGWSLWWLHAPNATDAAVMVFYALLVTSIANPVYSRLGGVGPSWLHAGPIGFAGHPAPWVLSAGSLGVIGLAGVVSVLTWLS